MKQQFSAFLGFLIFLVQPEDSSTGDSGSHDEYLGKSGYFAGTIKVMFWMVVAIAVSLMIAKL